MNNEYREINSFDGTSLKCLVRETGNRQWLIVTHGLGEHLGRHEFFLKLFAQNFNIAIYDLRGHGRSGGKRGFVENFSDFAKDLEAVILYFKKHFNLNEYILFGHSMGGLIVADYMQNYVKDDLYPEKVFLSSPAVAPPGIMGPIFFNAPKFILDCLVKLPTLAIADVLNLRKLSHDARIYEAYIKDEFTQLKIHTKLYLEIIKASREVFSRPLRIRCALYCVIGTEDVLVHPKILIKYFTEVEKNAQLKVFEGAYHELHNEIEVYRRPYFNFLRQSLTGLSFE